MDHRPNPYNDSSAGGFLVFLLLGLFMISHALTFVEPRKAETAEALVIEASSFYAFGGDAEKVKVQFGDGRTMSLYGHNRIGDTVCVETFIGKITKHVESVLWPLENCLSWSTRPT